MDLLFLILGGIVFYLSSKRKDENGKLDQTGGILRVVGIVMLIIGVFIFAITFSAGFMSAF